RIDLDAAAQIAAADASLEVLEKDAPIGKVELPGHLIIRRPGYWKSHERFQAGHVTASQSQLQRSAAECHRVHNSADQGNGGGAVLHLKIDRPRVVGIAKREQPAADQVTRDRLGCVGSLGVDHKFRLAISLPGSNSEL